MHVVIGIRWEDPRPSLDTITKRKNFPLADNIKMDVTKIECEIMNRFELSQDMVIWGGFLLAALNFRLHYNTIYPTKSNRLFISDPVSVISAWCCRH
jgi:hypothetical protein